jgi:hypothetical protein
MITPTKQLAAEALEELSDVLDFIASEKGEEDPMYLALSGVEEKLHIILRRLSHPVVQQETKKHIPEDPYKKASDFAEVKACVDAGKLPPLGSVKTGIQYINSKCYVEDGKLHWI